MVASNSPSPCEEVFKCFHAATLCGICEKGHYCCFFQYLYQSHDMLALRLVKSREVTETSTHQEMGSGDLTFSVASSCFSNAWMVSCARAILSSSASITDNCVREDGVCPHNNIMCFEVQYSPPLLLSIRFCRRTPCCDAFRKELAVLHEPDFC
jgi:hypothetical protein